jgi:hypothetical protein
MVVKELKNLRPFRDEGSLRGTTLVAQYSIKIDGSSEPLSFAITGEPANS